MPRPRLTDEEREVSQARRRQLDAARKRRKRMDASYRQIEQQANTEARRKAREVSRTLCESDVHKQDGDRVSTVNTDCSNSKPESTPSMEDNKSEKKRELATALPDTSVYFKEMSVGNNLGMLKLEPDSDKEAHVVPINTESEFIDIKQKGTPEFQSLKKDIDGDNGVDVTSSLRKGGGDEDASHVDNFPT
ncbi:uncharacterized protein LOC111861324 isoform X4 [Cryptotermes secundus]|uniref:uncharacterized protein LOC111861324 isoform X4 n=1 Tax=Cryptotermes secundus TaxID=105785 RepID=UPI000CD7BCEB|nr:uncharacterized protein LOC111861324 isoform X4 [Cryptotermes secundus]